VPPSDRPGEENTVSKPILVGYDPEHADRGPVRFGVAASRLTGAPLHVGSFFAGSVVVGEIDRGAMGEEPDAAASVALNHVKQELVSEGVEATYWSLGGRSAPAALHKAAEDVDANMLVVGSTHQHHGGVVRAGSTAERLLHGAPCPVAVVPQDWQMGAGLKVIGVAYVDTPEGRDAVRGALVLARQAGATLRVLAAVKSKHSGQSAGERPGAEVTAYDSVGATEQDAMRGASDVIRDGGGGVEVEMDVSAQEPEDFLVAASANVDLLVCGSRGYGPRRAVLLGGVTREVTRKARCPVIVLARGTESQFEELAGAPQPAVA